MSAENSQERRCRGGACGAHDGGGFWCGAPRWMQAATLVELIQILQILHIV